MKAIFQRFADKYDPEKDPRIHGDKEGEYVKIECPLCEDEGIVYYSRVDPDGVRYWFVARCSCPAVALPPVYRICVAKEKYQDSKDIPRWNQVMTRKGQSKLLTTQDIICVRLQPFAMETGVLPYPMLEPLRIFYRKRPEPDSLEYDRAQNQARADGEAGRKPEDEDRLKRAGLLEQGGEPNYELPL